MALCNHLGRGLLCRTALFYRAAGPATATSTRRLFSSADKVDAQEDGRGRPSQLSHHEKKVKIAAAWNSCAEAYVGSAQEGVVDGVSSTPSSGMSVGYKLAARIVTLLSNKQCEAAVFEGKEMCRARATHGEVGEGATACDLHKTDGMVRLREVGAPVILDVASAGGEPAMTIAKVLPDATVHATDVAPTMVELIRRRAADAGLMNVKADVADGEVLTGFEDSSVDALTCTWGLMFMPNWRRAVQEFSRVLSGDGVVVVTLWEKEEDSIFQRMASVLEVLTPGFKGLVDPEALGDDGGRAVVEEMEAAGLESVTVSKFSVPTTIASNKGAREIWERCALPSPLQHTLSSLEARGRRNVQEEAFEIFETQMDKDWAEGRTPLGIAKLDAGGDDSSVPQSPRIFYKKALVLVGRKTC